MKLEREIRRFLRRNWPLLLILGLAIFFRFYHLEEFLHFANDEGRDAYVVKEIVEQDIFRLTGPAASIGGFSLGPFFYYFLLPFYLIFNLHPVAGGFAVALLDLFTIGLIYFFTKRHFSQLAAIFATLLYATSFWVNLYERWGWNPNVLPFFTILTFWLCSRVFFCRPKLRARYLLALGATVGLAVQAHAQGIWLLPLIFLLFIAGNKGIQQGSFSIKRYLKLFVVFLSSFLLVNLPSLIFEVKTGGQNSRAIINWIFSIRESQAFGVRIEQGVGDFINFCGQLIFSQGDELLVLLMLLAPSFYLVHRYRKLVVSLWTDSNRRSFFALRAILSLTTLVFFSFFLISEKKYFHFFIILAPALFIYLGFLLARLYRISNWFGVGVLLMIGLLSLSNITTTTSYWSYLETGALTQEFDLPLKDMQAAVDYLVANSCAETRVKGEGIEDERRAFEYLFARAGRSVVWVEDCSDYEFMVTRDLTGAGERFGRLMVLEEQEELR
ncbi:MAG: glycosyltransferase family 39 protein [Parcubacteria group bacterium]|nr:glycosyltransferase family 39 protein [Parcubacteria group bacterium]